MSHSHLIDSALTGSPCSGIITEPVSRHLGQGGKSFGIPIAPRDPTSRLSCHQRLALSIFSEHDSEVHRVHW